MVRPSGEKAADLTWALWPVCSSPVKLRSSLPVATSQSFNEYSRQVLVPLPTGPDCFITFSHRRHSAEERASCPSGENATTSTGSSFLTAELVVSLPVST